MAAVRRSGHRGRSVVVVGGANMDLKATSAHPLVPGTSNPGTTVVTPGGVGRNIAENLARLGSRVHLVAAVGADALGDQLLAATAAAGVDVGHVCRGPHATGSYTALLDAGGELVAAVADMAATDALAADDVHVVHDLVAGAALLVLDGNLAPDTVAAALDMAAGAGVPVVLDPVSVPKASRAAGLLHPERPVHLVTPNAAELAALAGMDGGDGGGRVAEEAPPGHRVAADVASPGEAAPSGRGPRGDIAPAGHRVAADEPDDSNIEAAVRVLHGAGVELVWVRLGDDGSLLSGPDGVVRLPAPATEVFDVTGAGDAMLAAYCHATLRGAAPADAAAYGHAAAALTVASPHTVRPDLTDYLVQSRLP